MRSAEAPSSCCIWTMVEWARVKLSHDTSRCFLPINSSTRCTPRWYLSFKNLKSSNPCRSKIYDPFSSYESGNSLTCSTQSILYHFDSSTTMTSHDITHSNSKIPIVLFGHHCFESSCPFVHFLQVGLHLQLGLLPSGRQQLGTEPWTFPIPIHYSNPFFFFNTWHLTLGH